MINGLHHIALVVEDIDAAKRYYCGTSGMRCLPDAITAMMTPPDSAVWGGKGGATCGHDLLAGPNAFVELLSPQRVASQPEPCANPIHRPGIRHFCVQNHDCVMLEQAVTRHGGSLIAPPLDLGTGNQYAYARDPEGNIMEIEGLPYAPVAEKTWLGHVAIVTRDMDAAIAFYKQLFASDLRSRGRFGPGPQFDKMGGLVDARIEGAWLSVGNMLLELWQFHTPAYPAGEIPRTLLDPGYSHICLETSDLDADAQRLVALGGALTSQIAENEHVRSVFARDPEGNAIELLELRLSNGPHSIAALEKPDICARIDGGRCA